MVTQHKHLELENINNSDSNAVSVGKQIMIITGILEKYPFRRIEE